ncbi:hypothetical protein Glove_40g102 [Diversispora epigaea]|uniref:Uncharacterized protein n=1 Tax=Diversispora epigaea TaxID=1348612 RepID=A0A397JQG8_9GLOM|nr:hypothetical protein Glove_40g102 [Diversispora epigaea]
METIDNKKAKTTETVKNRRNNLNNNNNNNNDASERDDDGDELNFEFERLREILRVIIQKAIEEFIDLWLNVCPNMDAMNSLRAYKKNDRIRKKTDPRHFFQSSFRLLEEKWRKSCWPNLVKIKDKLIITFRFFLHAIGWEFC